MTIKFADLHPAFGTEVSSELILLEQEGLFVTPFEHPLSQSLASIRFSV
jgi:hypothetical protein